MAVNDTIGTQEVAYGGPILPKTPSDFTPPFPENSDPRKPNLMFNDVDKWTITTTEYAGEQLPEGSSYFYDQSIDVTANWWKKVAIVIWTQNGNPTTQTDLEPYVHVDNYAHYPTPPTYNTYGFYPDGTNVTFSVTGADTNTLVITVGGNRFYRFIGWAPSAPPVFETTLNPFQWCSRNTLTPHTHNNVQFDDEYCLYEEYAAFIDGTGVEIKITTNDPGTMGWNNDNKNPYLLKWSNSLETHEDAFMTLFPSEIGNVYSAPDTQIGNSFTCELKTPSSQHWKGIYEFKGWYLNPNPFRGFDPDEFAAIQATPYFFHHANDDMSDLIYAVQSEIVITAVWMPSSDTFTITYHSGLPGAPE